MGGKVATAGKIFGAQRQWASPMQNPGLQVHVELAARIIRKHTLGSSVLDR